MDPTLIFIQIWIFDSCGSFQIFIFIIIIMIIISVFNIFNV
jgi:hypothetical protein